MSNYPKTKAGNLDIPLSQIPRSTSFHNKVIGNVHKKYNAISPSKPGRMLGGPWLDQFVSRRMGVNFCDVCIKLYGRDLTRQHSYRGDPNPGGWKLGVCDGCARGADDNPITLIPMYPAEAYAELRIGKQSNKIQISR